MDMVLYSLMKQKIEDAPNTQVDNVGGYELRFVDSIPITRDANTIYIVMGEGRDGDRIVVGKQSVQNILFGDYMIDYGILNGNVFLDRYDFLRGLIRVVFTSETSIDDGYLDCATTVEGEKVDSLIITGKIKGRSHIERMNYYGRSMSSGNIVTEINRTMCGLPNGEGDVFDVLSGVYTNATISDTIDERITWTNVGLYGDYREFRATGYTGFIQPIYLTSSGVFNSENIVILNSENAFANNDFEVIGYQDDRTNKQCIYVGSSLLKVRILNSLLDTSSSSSLAKAMQKYLTENPITITMTRANPIIEQLAEPQELRTFDEVTQVRLEFEGDNPVIIAKVPIKE